MTEQTYDLNQQGAEVQAIINDANNCKGAGAQTTLTTESILLKDVNGQYHKILKSSFTEAIRDTLAGLLVNNDKGTTINQIAAIASGDFGSVTPANLASVLGAQDNNNWTRIIRGKSSGSRCYKVVAVASSATVLRFMGRTSSYYRQWNATVAIGKNVHEAYKEFGFGDNAGTYFSLYYTDDGTTATLYVETHGSVTMRVISPDPLTAFEELNALPEGATAIVPESIPVAIGRMVTTLTSGDLNNCTAPGNYRYTSNSASNIANKPTTDGAFRFWVRDIVDGIIQEGFKSDGTMYVRTKWDSNDWTTWRTIQTS